MADTLNWFDRRFSFDFGPENFDLIFRRLEAGPEQIAAAVAAIPEMRLSSKPSGKWSVKEHIGHLSLLEPLWRTRMHQIRDRAPAMAPADLSNAATDAGGFNGLPLPELLLDFTGLRAETLQFLRGLEPQALSRALPHPRLRQPMRLIDLMYFVAEHDDHHLAAIRQLN